MTHSKFNIFINPKNISVNDRGFNYGDGLFETILVKDSKVKYFRDHIDRLYAGCHILNINKPSRSILLDSIKKAIGKNKDCIIKIILSRGCSVLGYKFAKDIKHNLYLIKSQKVPQSSREATVKLKFSNYRIFENSFLSKIKHLNRIDQCLIANDYNHKRNINDLVVTYKKNIIETMSSNIFFIKVINSKPIFATPKISKFGIDGIMKNQIIKHLRKNKYKIIEKDISIRDLKNYQISFKVNSIQGLVFIDQIENNKFSHDQIIYNILKKFIY